MSNKLPTKEEINAFSKFERATLLEWLVATMVENNEGGFIEEVIKATGSTLIMPDRVDGSPTVAETEAVFLNSGDPAETKDQAALKISAEPEITSEPAQTNYLKSIAKLQGLSEDTSRIMKSLYEETEANPALFRNSIMRAPVSRKLLQSMILLNGGVTSFTQLETMINEIGSKVATKKINPNTLRGRISLWMKDGFISPIPDVQGSYTITVAQAMEAIERNEDFADINLDELFPENERGEVVEPKK